MKNQALFSLKDKNKNFKCRLLQFLFGALKVNAKFVLFTLDAFRILPSAAGGGCCS